MDWTGPRINDPAERVDAGFEEAKGEIEGLRKETGARFDKVDTALKQLDAKFDARFDRLTNAIIGATILIAGLTIVLAGANATGLLGG